MSIYEDLLRGIRRYYGPALAGIVMLLSGCSGISINDFEGSKPEFVVEEYFAGKTKAWGIVHDRSGKLIRQFTVDLNGEWDGTKLTLTEDFLYSDGKTEQRIWVITKLDQHTYEGRAADVVGVAIGKQLGQALHWTYTMNLPVGDSHMHIGFDDWMYLQPDNILINKARMKKFGLTVGEITLFFSK